MFSSRRFETCKFNEHLIIYQIDWKIHLPCKYPGSLTAWGWWWPTGCGGAEKALEQVCCRSSEGGPCWATPCRWVPPPPGGCMLERAPSGVYDLHGDSKLSYKEKIIANDLDCSKLFLALQNNQNELYKHSTHCITAC